ncbi:hypothetical protein EQG49_11130 [Periweissella cryptocerci]|uniref:ArpU family transcriptional regulator n=1 Tax=Periweissella cryptocerci TaxID=2506420 RepID=A0A4P6YVR7_9LACO|nr:ArpU family phage packaging/lysis transcriptional regulator [Periweissella cryptocerci]QBO36959.1 hypothetical protein EQG49_11130 [Periweissella cryptocerci]
MELLKRMDNHATKNRVRDFLTNELPQLMLVANLSQLDIKSPSFSDMPKGGGDGNSAEDNMTEYMMAREAVIAVRKTMDKIPSMYGTILKASYIDNVQDEFIMDRIGYKPSRYYELKDQAYSWFATAYPKEIIDFRVWLDSENRSKNGVEPE